MNLTETNDPPLSNPDFTQPDEPGGGQSPLSVNPNPAVDFVTVTLTEPQTATILLLDAAGTALIRKRIYYRAEVQLDVQRIPPGQYTVVAEYYGQTFSQKIAVNR